MFRVRHRSGKQGDRTGRHRSTPGGARTTTASENRRIAMTTIIRRLRTLEDRFGPETRFTRRLRELIGAARPMSSQRETVYDRLIAANRIAQQPKRSCGGRSFDLPDASGNHIRQRFRFGRAGRLSGPGLPLRARFIPGPVFGRRSGRSIRSPSENRAVGPAGSGPPHDRDWIDRQSPGADVLRKSQPVREPARSGSRRLHSPDQRGHRSGGRQR